MATNAATGEVQGAQGLTADVTRTSTTSLAIGTGSATFVFAIASSNLGWLVGTRLRAASNAGATNYMEGLVTAVSSTQVTINIDAIGGAGTKNDWNIFLVGQPFGAGALVLLEQHTASSSASLDFTTFLSNTYDEYVIEVVRIVPASNATNLRLQVSTDGGSTWDTTSGHYGWSVFVMVNNASGPNGSESDTAMSLGLGISSTASDGGYNASYRLFDPQNASNDKVITGYAGGYLTSNSKLSSASIAARYMQTTAITALRFLMSSGSIASGTVRIYGVANIGQPNLSVGAVAFVSAANPATVNLSTQGTKDWMTLNGTNPNYPRATAGPHAKVLGGWILNSFDWFAGTSGTGPVVGGTSAIAMTTTAADDMAVALSAVTPNATYMGGSVNAINYGYRFRVPADTFSRILKLNLGVFGVKITITCRMTDGSVADQTTTVDAVSDSAFVQQEITMTYNAGSYGAQMCVDVRVTTSYEVSAHLAAVYFMCATLA